MFRGATKQEMCGNLFRGRCVFTLWSGAETSQGKLIRLSTDSCAQELSKQKALTPVHR